MNDWYDLEDMAALKDLKALEDLEALENLEALERRYRYVPDSRNNDLDDLDDIAFKASYRFKKSTVEDVVSQIKENLESDTCQNSALTAEEKTLAAIRFFAFGNHQINIGDMHQMSQSSSNRCINQVAKSLAKLCPKYIYMPQTEAERSEISQKFYSRFGFPNVLGALDCTLIRLESPGGDMAETFRSRKGTFGLNVQTLSDADLYIRNIVVRWPGSTHDCHVFDHSFLRAHLEVDVPKKYHVLGDSGYPLRSYLLTPILNPNTVQEVRYNAAQINARKVVERQHEVWKRRFSSIGSTMRCHVESGQTIIVATAVLHNIALKNGDNIDENLPKEDDNIDGNPPKEGEKDLTHTASIKDGVLKRNGIIASYFS